MTPIREKDTEDGARYFQAESDLGRVVGLAVASINNKNELDLESIHVQLSDRRQGWGRKLLQAVLGWGRSRGAERMTGKYSPLEDREAAIQFYRSQGVDIEDENLNKRL